MGSRNCQFCIVNILRDGGSGVSCTPEIRVYSLHLRLYVLWAHLALYSVGAGTLYLGVMRLKLEAGN
jgi:hypothetical protein